MQFSDKARRLANLSVRISRLQKMISERPDDERLFIALSGLAKRAEMAREAFSEVVETSSLEVLDYRIRKTDEFYPLKSVTESLGSFQTAITSVHDAVVNGPKKKAKYSEEMQAQTSLNFEFFYPGSKGFILSVPTEQNLFGGSLDETADAIVSYLEISDTNMAIDASRTLGLAAVSSLYQWVEANFRWGNSIDYEWKARRDRATGQHVSIEKFQMLEEIFRGAEEVDRTKSVIKGILVGLDVSKRSFHFVEPNGSSYTGRLHSDFTSEERVVPRRYAATVIESTVRKPATGDEKLSYELVNLEALT